MVTADLRFGRRKPFIAPLLACKLLGFAMYLTPITTSRGYLNIQAWYLVSNATVSVRTSLELSSL